MWGTGAVSEDLEDFNITDEKIIVDRYCTE